MENLAPVCIIVYNRADKVKRTIECLSQNTLAQQTEVYIFSDAPKDEDAKQGVEEVRAFLHHLKATQTHGFKSLTIIEATQNLRIKGSVIKQGDYMFREKQYECFIGLEDDIETHPNFLQYMNDALRFYRDNKKVMAVTAFAHQVANLNSTTLKKYPHNVLFSYAFHSWGWGIWKDRWDQIDWLHSDIKYYIYNPKHWIIGGILSWFHLLAIKNSEDNGLTTELWDIHLSQVMYQQNKVCVWPSKLSYTRNFGFDGSGVHKFNFDENIVNFEFANPPEKLTFTNEMNMRLWFHFKIGVRYGLEVWLLGFMKMLYNKFFGKK